MSKTIFNPDFIISPNQLGSRLKTSENLNHNQPVVLEAKLEYPLGEFASLRCFQVWLFPALHGKSYLTRYSWRYWLWQKQNKKLLPGWQASNQAILVVSTQV